MYVCIYIYREREREREREILLPSAECLVEYVVKYEKWHTDADVCGPELLVYEALMSVEFQVERIVKYLK
jgi:hypothetical protein